VEKAHYERSDISVVPAAGVVGEAMVMLTLAAAVLEKTGGDSMDEVRESMARWRERLARPFGAGVASDDGASGGEPRVPAGTAAAAEAERGDGSFGSGGDD
jgi:hypothetical protein